MSAPDIGPPVHPLTLDLVSGPGLNIPAGTPVHLAVHVSCTAGCAAIPQPQLSVTRAGDKRALEPRPSDPESRDAVHVQFIAPSEVGCHRHELEVAEITHDGVKHSGAVIAFDVTTVPHQTAMAAWGAPNVAVRGTKFTVNVGLRCEVGCDWSRAVVAIRDERGVVQGTGRLGTSPWPGTDGLFWASIELCAPDRTGVLQWTAFFEHEGPLAHIGSTASFGLLFADPPDVDIAIELVDEKTATAVSEAELHLGRYTSRTDRHGCARFAVPAGRYPLTVRKDGIDVEPRAIEATANCTVRVGARMVPTHAELVDMMKRFEGDYWRP